MFLVPSFLCARLVVLRELNSKINMAKANQLLGSFWFLLDYKDKLTSTITCGTEC
jgi:hypothetical protein